MRPTPPSPRSGHRAPLHYAVREGHANVVQLLLQHSALAHGVVEHLCRWLALHHGVNPKEIGLWTLFHASGNAHMWLV
jgi:ankyrin repeat protein